MGNQVTQETLDAIKKAGSQANDELRKSIGLATGLVAYDLQAPAKNLYPVITPIRNGIPRIGGGVGTATNWRQVSAITGSGVASMPWVPEGQRTARMSYTTANKAATYVTLGEEDDISLEAIHAGRTFEDLKATMVVRLLQQTMIKEEHAVLGGNASIALGTPVTPTVANAGTGGSIAAATYNVAVVALTYEGYQVASLANGVSQANVITGADGKTYTLNGGSSQKSATAPTTTSGSTSTISASTTAIQGAVAYAWFVGTSGAEKLEAITTINSVKLLALAGTHQALSAVTADCSRNTSYAFDGLLTNALNTANASNVTILATGTAGTGTPLTASGRGSISEIDAMLKTMWDTYRVSPTVIYVNSQEQKNMTDKVLSNATTPLLRYNMSASGSNEPMGIVAGGVVTYYFNPYTANPGGMMIPVRLHPYLPAGTILLHCENLPVQYQNNEVPNVAEMRLRQDFYQIDWPMVTRRQEVGTYVEEVLAVYAPFALGCITNIANG
jgi:hypothetical protein